VPSWYPSRGTNGTPIKIIEDGLPGDAAWPMQLIADVARDTWAEA
jgi:hypothetical protein